MKKAGNRKLIYLSIAIFGAILVWWGTARGAGVGGDATIYMESAENFAKGIGLGIFNADGSFRMIPYFPPFFPLVLSIFALFGLDLEIVARILNLFLFTGTIYLILQITDEYVSDWRYVIGLGLLIVFSPVVNPIFCWAMSEPLSIFLGTFAFFLILKYFQSGSRISLFYLSAILSGLSTLTRYGAIVYAATVCVLLLLFDSGKLLKRFGKTVLYGIISIIPVGIWAVIDILHTDTVSSRSVNQLADISPRILSFFADLKSVILFWFIPDSWIQAPSYPEEVNLIFVILFVIGIGVLSWMVLKKVDENRSDKIFITSLLLFIILYVLMTLIISLATYPPITIGTRMFSPMYLMVFWLIIICLFRVSSDIGKKHWLNIGTFAVLCLLVLWSSFRGIRIIQDNHQTGLGFQSSTWQSSDLIAYVNQLPTNEGLITNEEMAVFALTGRNAYPLAEVYVDQPYQKFTRYGDGENPSSGEALFYKGDAYLVLFESIYSQFEGIYGEQSEYRINVLTNGLELIYQGEDGWVYLYPSSIEE